LEADKDHEEFREDDTYMRPLRGHLQPSIRGSYDLFEGYFVAI